MRVEWLCCVPLIGGCDVVFRLDHLEPRHGDAPPLVTCEQDGHDEDGDGVPDGCDRCPGIADDQADADNDGVGDACDPNATTRDEIALFLSFADGQSWRVLAGNWFGDGESLVYDAPTFSGFGIALWPGVMPEPPFVVEYHYRIDAMDAIESSLQVVLDADASGTGVVCGNVRHDTPTLIDVVRSVNPKATTSNELEIMTVTPGNYRVIATYDRTGQIRCAFAADDNSTGGAVMVSWQAANALAPGSLGFRSMRFGVHVHYVVVYKTY